MNTDLGAKIKWAVCDDADYICTNFKMDLSRYDNFEFLWKANSGAQCLQLMEQSPPDILLLDIQMETETTGIDILPELKELSPSTKIIMLTSFDDSEYIFSAFANGAESYLVKTTEADKIAETMVSVRENKTMLPPDIARKLALKSKQIANSQKSLLYTAEIMSRLSASEYIILKEVCAGRSYKEIAQTRFVDVSTVRTHASRIIKKFNLPSMNDVVKALRELNVMDWL